MTGTHGPAGHRPDRPHPAGDVPEEQVGPDLLVGDVVDPEDGSPVPADGAASQAAQAAAAAAGPAAQGVDPSTLDRDDLQHVVEVALSERNEYLEALKRLQAEFENFRKRTQREQAEAGTKATERLMAELLPVFDTVELAKAHADSADLPLATQLMGILKKEGLERLYPKGEAFDPNLHEAVMHAEGSGDQGPVVVEVFRAGWRWKGWVIRPAMVKVEG